MTHPEINVNKKLCKGCKICVDMCPMKALEISNELASSGNFTASAKKINKCIGAKCRLCELVCPDFAIEVKVE